MTRVEPSFAGGLATYGEVTQRLFGVAALRGLSSQSKVVAVADGGNGLKEALAEQFTDMQSDEDQLLQSIPSCSPTKWHREGRTEFPQEFGGSGSDGRRGEMNLADINGASVVSGIYGGGDDEVNRLGAICSTMRIERINGEWALTTHYAGYTSTGGGNGGNSFDVRCADGTASTGMSLRVGNLVVNISRRCESFRAPRTPRVT